MSAGGNLPNLKQLRKMVKETESKLKGSRPPENEEDVIREYEIPEPRTKALLKEEMQALENELTEHFEENYVDDDLNLSEGSDNKEIDVVSPFAGTIRDLDPLLKSHGTELKDSVFLTWSGPGEVHTEKLRPTDDDAVRIGSTFFLMGLRRSEPLLAEQIEALGLSDFELFRSLSGRRRGYRPEGPTP